MLFYNCNIACDNSHNTIIVNYFLIFILIDVLYYIHCIKMMELLKLIFVYKYF